MFSMGIQLFNRVKKCPPKYILLIPLPFCCLQIKTFTVNPENIKLFNLKTLPKNVLNRYTELVFLQNPSFSLFE